MDKMFEVQVALTLKNTYPYEKREEKTDEKEDCDNKDITIGERRG